MSIQARLTNTAPGPRGVWANGDLIDVQPGVPTVLTFASTDELSEVNKAVFGIETDVAFDAKPAKRLFLALADGEDGAGFRYVDMGKASRIGFAVAAEAPALPAGYRWESVVAPDGFTFTEAEASDVAREAESAPEPESPLSAALSLLDPANDDHWTGAGLPAVDAVSEIVGEKVTRAQIEAAAPDLTRESAKEAIA